jgi:PAS domain S-box-containing protein
MNLGTWFTSLRRGRVAAQPAAALKRRDGNGNGYAVLESLVITKQVAEARRAAEMLMRNGGAQFRAMLDAIPAGVYTTDAEGRLSYYNPAAAEMAGRTPQLGIDQWCMSWKLRRPDGSLLPHDECPMAVSLKEGRPLRGIEVIVERPDGSRVPCMPFPTPLHDAQGKLIGGVNMVFDLTGTKRNVEALSRLAAIVDCSDDAIIGKTLQGVITSWNRGAEVIFGYTAREAVGQHISLIIPEERRAEEETVLQRLRNGEKINHFETTRRTKSGRILHVSLTVSPVSDAEGRVTGASKVLRDITQRKLVEEALKQADRNKDEFLAMLSHELRNPLAPIRNAIALLQDIKDDAQIRELATGILDRQVSQLTRLVEDLLDINRISRGGISLQKRSVTIAEIVEAAVETSRPLVDGGGHQLEIDVPAASVTLFADPVRLTQVIANLINNAAKCTLPGGRIDLSVEKDERSLIVLVRDNGIGIAAEDLPHVFEMFRQVGKPQHKQGGLGVGLALARELVALHGGTIRAESAGIGCGAKFIVRLPLSGASSAPVAAN